MYCIYIDKYIELSEILYGDLISIIETTIWRPNFGNLYIGFFDQIRSFCNQFRFEKAFIYIFV